MGGLIHAALHFERGKNTINSGNASFFWKNFVGWSCMSAASGHGKQAHTILCSYFSRSAIVRIRVGRGVVRIQITRRQVAVVSVVARANTHRLLPSLPFQEDCPHALRGRGHCAGLVRYDAAKLEKNQKKTAPKGG